MQLKHKNELRLTKCMREKKLDSVRPPPTPYKALLHWVFLPNIRKVCKSFEGRAGAVKANWKHLAMANPADLALRYVALEGGGGQWGSRTKL